MNFILDFSEVVWAINCYRVSDFEFEVPANEWAPGIWAGAEKCLLSIGGDVFRIISIDLKNRLVVVNQKLPHNLEKFEIRPYLETK